jgi:tryptophan synthase alpha chain
MSRINDTFEKCKQENRKALVVFVTAGNPDMESSEKLCLELIDAGADIIELGVPFSDPMADGPTIQESSCRALEAGANLPDIMKMAERIRKQTDTPMILFSYYNVILSYGLEKLAEDCEKVGIDGLLTVDVPFEESDEIKPILDKHNLSLIPLIAPTTPVARAAEIVKNASGFVYYITVKGVTGARSEVPKDLQERLAELRNVCPIPVVAGFGISTPEMASATAKHADGIVVGSALVRFMNQTSNAEDGIAQCRELVHRLSNALLT